MPTISLKEMEKGQMQLITNTCLSNPKLGQKQLQATKRRETVTSHQGEEQLEPTTVAKLASETVKDTTLRKHGNKTTNALR